MPDYILDDVKLKELDANIREMIRGGASQDDVTKYSEDFGKMFGKKKDGTTAPPSTPSKSQSLNTPSLRDLANSFRQPQVSDSPSPNQRIQTNIKAQDKAQGNVPVLPTLEVHNKEVQAAKNKVATTIQNSDKILDGLIREGRVAQLEADISRTPRLDGMPMPALQTAKREIFTKSIVTPEEISVKKNQAIEDPNLARKVISRSAKTDPSISKSMYLIDAEERAAQDPSRTQVILDNAKKIEAGEIRYNINRGILEKPENFVVSGIRGFKERSKQLDDYNFFTETKNDDAIISQLEADMKDVDPDRPVPVADGGTSQFTQMLGMEGIPMLKSSASAIVTGMIPGGQAAAPFVAAAVSSPEYYKRSYASALRESYYQLRQSGKNEREALDIARRQAEAEGRLGAAEGAISSAVGARIGFKPTSIASSPGLKGALTNLVKAGGNFAKESIPEGVSDGLVAGALQMAKNIEAQNNGLNRDIMDGVDDNVAGEVLFALGSGALISGGKTVLNPETLNTIKTYIARQPKEVVDAKIGEMLLTGKVTPKKAVEFAKEIEDTRTADSKIPDSVADVAVRTEIQGKIKERDDLKAKLATVDPVFHKPIQEQINNIESDILNMSSAPVAPQVSKIESLSPDAIEVSGNAEGFAQQMTDAQQSLGNAGLSVSPYAQEDYDQIAQEGGKFLRADGGKILGLLKPNGEMVSLVKSAASSVKGAAQAMITKMKDMGGLFMDNYDIYLTPLYEKAGYKVVARVPFNEEYAPEGWNAEDSTLKSKPDVVFMVREDLAPGEAVKFENYEDAQAYTQGLVDKAIADGKAQLPSSMIVDEQGQLIDNRLQDAVAKASKSLEKAGIKFNIIDSSVNPEQADAARGNQAIFRDTDGTVTIDRSKLANDIEAGIVVWHESSHPVINIIRNTDRNLYDAVVRGLTDAAKKNAGVQKALNWAEDGYEGNDVQADEALVETIARIAEGVVDVSKLDTGLRQRIIDFINDIAKYFGIDPILSNTDLAEFKRVATEVADALSQGKDISEIVGDKNVKEYMNTLPSPSAVASGEYTPQAKVAGGIDVYASKETESLPTKTLQEIYDIFGGRAVVINSDPTRVGELKLPSGKTIFMYGGPGYLSVKDNVNGNVGFATTQLSKVKTWQKYVNELFGNEKGVTFVATQAPTSILSNSYALRYVMDAISMLPKGVLKSSEFKSEFFGKDLVLLKDAFGEKAYNDFVSKYKKADLSDAKVIDEMIAEMAYKVGDDNKPASFKARGAFVSNLLGGVEAKKKLKTVEGDTGYVSKKPTKYISGQLFNRLGINAEKVMREIGEPSLVDLWFNEGKWGMVVSGFETDPNVSIDSVQDSGVKHPLFNAKFPGTNPFVFDGAYEVDSMFKPVEITGPSGAPYTKRAAQMLAGSMYVKGQPGSTDTAFEYTPTVPAAEKIQASVGNRGDVIEAINWQKATPGKGDPKISARNPVVTQAAADLKAGKITNEEYRAIATENSPIRPITKFFEPATEQEVRNALSSDKIDKVNSPIADGSSVGLRLDIPAFKNNNTWVVSVHEGNTNAGKSISYTNVARITDVNFGLEPKAGLKIAAGESKSTIGRIFGKWQNFDGATMEDQGETAKAIIEDAVNNPDWVQVGFNPFRHSYFYDRSSDMGRPIVSADEVVQVGGLVYAKNPQYGNWTDESYRVKGLFDAAGAPVQFSVGNRSEDDLRAEGKGKERDRALASKFGALSDETQAKIDDDAVTYFQRPNKQTEKAVEEFIDGINLIDAADYVLSNPDIPEVSKVWMAATVAKRLNAEIDAAKAANDGALVDALTSKQADIYNEFAKKATSLGQAVQAFIAFRNDPNAAEFFLPKILRQLKKAGADQVTEEQKAEILNRLRDVNKAANGLPKDKAIISLSHYLAGIAPMKPIDVLQAIWYAKILSGITTQSTNLFANMFNTLFELPAVGLRIALMSGNPMAVLYGMKGFAGGVAKGAVAAADIIKSGVKSKEADKYFSENPLEYFTWSKWMGEKGKVLDKIPPLNFGAWKYVGRFLSATDAMFSTANQEAVANMLAYAEAGGNPSTAKFRQVNQLLGNTKMNILRANAQAKAEGFDINSLQGKRRVIEIVNQNRGTKITEEADAIGKRITMNYDPEGWTKPIFDAVVGLQRNIPAIKMVIPFARIVANLTENSLNYTPFGLVRAATGKRNPFNKNGAQLTTEERVDLLSKFAIGVGALAILATKVGKDDDDWFDLTAGGPVDPQQKYELMKGKWRPYTITLKDGTKISYKDWPIAGILAGMGHIRDAKKYSFDDSTQLGLYATGFFLNFYDKSLMSGLSDFFGMFSPKLGRGKYAPDDTGVDRIKKYAAQQVRSVALSNLAQQTGKLYSELVTGDPQRDARTFMEVLYRDMPVMNDGIRPIIDVFGEPVKYTTTERLTPVSNPEGDKLIEWLNENKLWVGVPKRQNIFDLATKTERPMTDDEYYEYRKLSGQKTKAWINRLINQVKSERREVSEAAFEAAKEAAREQAYFEIMRKSR